MKALIVTTIGGFLSQFEMNDVQILQSHGIEVHYASNFNNPIYDLDLDALNNDGIKTHHIDIKKSPIHLWSNLKVILKLKEIIDSEQIDLIHCHNPMGGVAARFAAQWSRRKPYVIYTAHGFHFYKGAPFINWILFYTAERLLARYTDVIITINQEDRRRAERFRLRKNGSVFQIPGVGVDMGRFSPKAWKNKDMREELKIPEHAFHIVTAAELNENKNQAVIIRAIAELGDADIYYSLCGKGPRKLELQELISRFELDDRVRLLGYRYDMAEVLQTADCFAFPSYREGLGVAAIEALACAVPVVAADNRGTREYMRTGVNGVVCKADDIQAFRDALIKLKTDKKYHAQLSTQCRESVEGFSIEQTDKIMSAVYQQAVERLEDRYGRTGKGAGDQSFSYHGSLQPTESESVGSGC